MKYFYKPDSLLSEIEFLKTEKDSQRAYLLADAGADKSALQQLREGLAEQGYLTIPTEHEGKPALEVRKFSSTDKLLGALKKLSATGEVAKTEGKDAHKTGWWQWLKNNPFKSSLGIYIFGDVGYAVYGKYKEKFSNEKHHILNTRKTRDGKMHKPDAPGNPYDKYAGWAYFAGTAVSIASTMLRGDQSDDEIEGIATDIKKKLKEDGGSDKTSTALKGLADDDAKQGFTQKVKQVFAKYPSELLNSFYALAGLFLAIAAKGHLKHNKVNLKTFEAEKNALSEGTPQFEQYERWIASESKKIKVSKQDIALGSITLGSGVLATAVKEKVAAPNEEPPKGAFAKAKRWLEEKPLRIAGIGYLVSTVIHFFSTTSDYTRIGTDIKGANKVIKSSTPTALGTHAVADARVDRGLAKRERNIVHGRMLFVVTNIIAEVLLTLSSKGHGDGVLTDQTVKKSALGVAAENIALQPEAERAHLVKSMATHLASPKIMGGSAYLIEKGIQEKIDMLNTNPWSDTQNTPQAEPASTR
jgi:hypothetical protein